MKTVAECVARIRRIAKIANDIEANLDQLHGPVNRAVRTQHMSYTDEGAG